MKKLLIVFMILGFCMAPAAAMASNTLLAEWSGGTLYGTGSVGNYTPIAPLFAVWGADPHPADPYLAAKDADYTDEGLKINTSYDTDFYLYAYNYDCTNTNKDVQIRLIYKGGPVDFYVDVDASSIDYVDIEFTGSFTSGSGDSMQTSSFWTISLEPNPYWEKISFDFDCPYIYLQGAAIGTDCYTVPIPGAVWLLGSGLFGLIGIRRRMKK